MRALAVAAGVLALGLPATAQAGNVSRDANNRVVYQSTSPEGVTVGFVINTDEPTGIRWARRDQWKNGYKAGGQETHYR